MNFRKRPWRHDPRSRNFSHQRFFGSTNVDLLTLNRPRQPVLYQGPTQRCTGYSAAGDGGNIHGIVFSGDWCAAKVGQVQGRSVDIDGGDPNAAMKAERDYGFLPIESALFDWSKDGIDGSGMDVWPKDLDARAATFDTIPGYVRVDGPYDTFDNIKSALRIAYDFNTKRGATVRAFGRWLTNWSNTQRGIIPEAVGPLAGYHAYLFVDWETVDGVEYLIAQNSYGTAFGDQGYHRFPRSVINREFALAGTTLKIVKTLTADQIALAKQDSPFAAIQRAIINIWYILSDKFGAPIDQERLSLLQRILELAGQWLGLIEARQTAENAPQPTPAPQTTPTPPPPHLDRLEAFCTLIRNHEGWAPGTRSYRNNNPGNCRYSTQGYLPMYGHVGKDKDGFAIFRDYATGWTYLKNLVRAKAGAHPGWTILDFTKEYAPTTDGNDPAIYAQFIAKGLGVTVDTPLRSLFA